MGGHVCARRDPGGEEYLVVADASDTVEALLAAVHEALSLGEGAEWWEVVHVDGDGEEHSLRDYDAGAELSEVGILGVEEVVEVRAGAKIIVRTELKARGIGSQEAAWRTFQRLIREGGDVDRALLMRIAESGWVARMRTDGDDTALHLVVRNVKRHGKETAVAMLESLLSNGSSVDAATDSGRTPLHLAADGDQPEVAELLIAHGADMNAVDKVDRKTPLHMAAWRGHSVAQVLVNHGAAVDIEDNYGLQPVHCWR